MIKSAPGHISHGSTRNTLLSSRDCEWILVPPAKSYVSIQVTALQHVECYTQLSVFTHTHDDKYPGWHLCDNADLRKVFPLSGVPFHLASASGRWLRIQFKNKEHSNTTEFEISYSFQGGYTLSLHGF